MEEKEGYFQSDEMLEASIPKRNYFMNRHLIRFEGAVCRAESDFSLNKLYQHLRAVVPQNLTVNSLQTLRDVVENIPRFSQLRVTRRFFKTFFKFLGYLQRLAEIFKARIYSVLLEFFFDSSFIQLRDLHVKKGGPVKDQGFWLPPELVREVGELCRQLLLNIEGLEDTLTTWQELLNDSEIDPNLFDDNSAHSIQQFRNCSRFQNILRLVPDVLNKSRMSVVLARAWWYKAEKIRRKLAGNPVQDSGVSSCSEIETPSVTSKSPPRLTKRQKAVANNPVPQQPSLFRKKKVQSLEDMDMERTSHIQKQPPPGDSATGQETLNQSRAVKKKPAESKDQHDRSNAGKTDDQSQTKDDAKAQNFKIPGTKPPNNSYNKRDPMTSKSQKNATPNNDEDTKIPSNQYVGQHGRSKATKINGQSQMNDNAKIHKSKLTGTPPPNRNKKRYPVAAPPTDDEDTQIPSNQDEGTSKARKRRTKAKSEDTKKSGFVNPSESFQNEAKEEYDFMRSTQDGMGTLSLDQTSGLKDGEPHDTDQLCWQENKLMEMVRDKLEPLIEAKETQMASLKLLSAMKDSLARNIERRMFRCSYRMKCRLQARVELLMKKTEGWKEKSKSLDSDHELLKKDLRREKRINGPLYRYIDVPHERLAYLDDLVEKERVGIDQLSKELGVLKDNAEQMHYYGMTYDLDFDDYDLDLGSWEGGFDKYPYRAFGAFGAGYNRPYYRFLRDEELLLGGSLRSSYERSLWNALKSESVDTLPFMMSPEDNFSWPFQALRARETMFYRDGKDQGNGYREDEDSPSDSDGAESGFQPQMYDQKRDDKQPPDYFPI